MTVNKACWAQGQTMLRVPKSKANSQPSFCNCWLKSTSNSEAKTLQPNYRGLTWHDMTRPQPDRTQVNPVLIGLTVTVCNQKKIPTILKWFKTNFLLLDYKLKIQECAVSPPRISLPITMAFTFWMWQLSYINFPEDKIEDRNQRTVK